MTNEVDLNPQVNNQVPEKTTIQVNQKKQRRTKKSGLAGNHRKSEVWNYFKKVLDEKTGKYKVIAVVSQEGLSRE
ncbi:hypothetical protein PRUPE_8G047400 [Prunus persica]|uniref:Uncharacterized protein n=1 Tax=Prunus persica TaxID=3760 RepID=A0A251MT81_PRUPE|nr:hypothetical protein PRUPE_8G047400 [Prunus persica]ONH90337.1 hypothetical protein PRUPE_8G047400 [Prunus persica]